MNVMKKVLLLTLTTILLFSMNVEGLNVNATTDVPRESGDQLKQGPNSKLLESLEKISEITNTRDKSFWTKRAKQIIGTKRVSVNEENLSYGTAKVYKIDNSPYVAVGIPVVSSNHHEVSNVSIYFNEKTKKLQTYTEMEFKRSEQDTFHILLSVNGKEQINELTEDPFMTEKEVRESSAGQIGALGVDWDKVGDCLGISGMAARWLSYICGATCVITLGTACVVCVTAAIGITGGTALACLGQYWD